MNNLVAITLMALLALFAYGAFSVANTQTWRVRYRMPSGLSSSNIMYIRALTAWGAARMLRKSIPGATVLEVTPEGRRGYWRFRT